VIGYQCADEGPQMADAPFFVLSAVTTQHPVDFPSELRNAQAGEREVLKACVFGSTNLCYLVFLVVSIVVAANSRPLISSNQPDYLLTRSRLPMTSLDTSDLHTVVRTQGVSLFEPRSNSPTDFEGRFALVKRRIQS